MKTQTLRKFTNNYYKESYASISYFLTFFQPNVVFHIETGHLICIANQITGFYTECNTRLKWVKAIPSLYEKTDLNLSLQYLPKNILSEVGINFYGKYSAISFQLPSIAELSGVLTIN